MWNNIFIISLVITAICSQCHSLGYPYVKPENPLELPTTGSATFSGYPKVVPDKPLELPASTPASGTVLFPPESDVTGSGANDASVTTILQKPNEAGQHHHHGEDGQYNAYDDGTGWDIRKSVPGQPGKDYPTLESIPRTSFKCSDKVPGYYADPETQCQVFRVCTTGSVDAYNSFICPNGSLFNQAVLTCDWWMNVDCQASKNFYYKNKELGKLPEGSQLMFQIQKMLQAPLLRPYRPPTNQYQTQGSGDTPVPYLPPKPDSTTEKPSFMFGSNYPETAITSAIKDEQKLHVSNQLQISPPLQTSPQLHVSHIAMPQLHVSQLVETKNPQPLFVSKISSSEQTTKKLYTSKIVPQAPVAPLPVPKFNQRIQNNKDEPEKISLLDSDKKESTSLDNRSNLDLITEVTRDENSDNDVNGQEIGLVQIGTYQAKIQQNKTQQNQSFLGANNEKNNEVQKIEKQQTGGLFGTGFQNTEDVKNIAGNFETRTQQTGNLFNTGIQTTQSTFKTEEQIKDLFDTRIQNSQGIQTKGNTFETQRVGGSFNLGGQKTEEVQNIGIFGKQEQVGGLFGTGIQKTEKAEGTKETFETEIQQNGGLFGTGVQKTEIEQNTKAETGAQQIEGKFDTELQKTEDIHNIFGSGPQQIEGKFGAGLQKTEKVHNTFESGAQQIEGKFVSGPQKTENVQNTFGTGAQQTEGKFDAGLQKTDKVYNTFGSGGQQIEGKFDAGLQKTDEVYNTFGSGGQQIEGKFDAGLQKTDKVYNTFGLGAQQIGESIETRQKIQDSQNNGGVFTSGIQKTEAGAFGTGAQQVGLFGAEIQKTGIVPNLEKTTYDTRAQQISGVFGTGLQQTAEVQNRGGAFVTGVQNSQELQNGGGIFETRTQQTGQTPIAPEVQSIGGLIGLGVQHADGVQTNIGQQYGFGFPQNGLPFRAGLQQTGIQDAGIQSYYANPQNSKEQSIQAINKLQSEIQEQINQQQQLVNQQIAIQNAGYNYGIGQQTGFNNQQLGLTNNGQIPFNAGFQFQNNLGASTLGDLQNANQFQGYQTGVNGFGTIVNPNYNEQIYQNYNYQTNSQDQNGNYDQARNGAAQSFKGESLVHHNGGGQTHSSYSGNNVVYKESTKVEIVPSIGFTISEETGRNSFESAVKNGLIQEQSAPTQNFSPTDVRFSSYQGPSSYLVPQSSVQRLPSDSHP